jgi:hypothetical protein
MVANNLTLEEYHALVRNSGRIFFTTPEGTWRAVYFVNSYTIAALPGQILSVSLASKYSGEFIITIEPTEPLFDAIGHWAETHIRRLHELGIISGYPDYTFHPARQVSRAEFITMLARLEIEAGSLLLTIPPFMPIIEELEDEAEVESAEEVNGDSTKQSEEDAIDEEPSVEELQPEPEEDRVELPPAPISRPLMFTDITSTAFYYDSLNLVYRGGLLRDLDLPQHGTLFLPQQPILRGEVALILVRLFDYSYFVFPDTLSYTDLAGDNFKLLQAAEILTYAGIFIGDDAGLFHPEREISRAEVATLFARLLDFIEHMEIQRMDFMLAIPSSITITSAEAEYEPYTRFLHGARRDLSGILSASGLPPFRPSGLQFDEILGELPLIEYAEDFQINFTGRYTTENATISYRLYRDDDGMVLVSAGENIRSFSFPDEVGEEEEQEAEQYILKITAIWRYIDAFTAMEYLFKISR